MRERSHASKLAIIDSLGGGLSIRKVTGITESSLQIVLSDTALPPSELWAPPSAPFTCYYTATIKRARLIGYCARSYVSGVDFFADKCILSRPTTNKSVVKEKWEATSANNQ